MTINEILNLGHISSSEVPNYTRIQTEEGYYMTAWTEGDDIRKYAGSNVYYLPVRENYDYPDLRVITVEEHERLSAERDAELEINPLVIVLKPQEKEVLITSNGDTIVTPDEGFNGLTEVNISVEVPIPEPDLRQLNLSVTENGSYEYDTPDNIDGYNKVNLTVTVPEPIFETETLSVELKENGTYNYTPTTDGYSSVEVTVDVAGSGGGLLVVPFEEIGYPTELKNEINNELNSKPLSDLEYSKSLYDKWNPNSTSLSYNGDIKLVYCPLIDTSKVTYMNSTFSGCTSLTTIPLLDTSKVTSMRNAFRDCTSLTSLPLLDTSSVTEMNNIFGYSDLKNLTNLGGFKNLGMQSNITGTNDNYFLYKVPNMTHESIMNIINNLYDRASAGYSVVTLKLAAKTLALLSDEEKTIATNKGWTLS
jgi:surface protein